MKTTSPPIMLQAVETEVPTLHSPADEELMERICARDQRALEIFIKRFKPLLHGIVSQVLSNAQDVKDVIEEVFLSVWNQAAHFDPAKGKLVGWIITIGRRRAIDRLRRRRTYDRGEMRFRVYLETGSSPFARDDVQMDAVNSDAAAIFQRILSAIPPAQSTVVRMAFYGGLSHREIALETGIPLGTIKTRLELGVKKLRVAVAAIGSREDWLGISKSQLRAT